MCIAMCFELTTLKESLTRVISLVRSKPNAKHRVTYSGGTKI
ncbi:unnamed protein product [Brassica oleracea]|uniref:(rape) hypothetical protein n=1 Tax=Brassica napus TaxID=3708 RepID=A0A816RAI0_BRANA|nr:unnamed protein product [Brassica napus]